MKAALTYHSIDDSGSPISVSAKSFDAHFRWLSSGNVRVLSLSELSAHADQRIDAVALTFDDGFLNTREAVERLAGAGLPVTMFVVSGRVGETNAWQGKPARGIPTMPLLGWRDLERLAGKNVSIEAHTRTHRSLTALSSTELEDELGGCYHDLQRRLGVRSTLLAYPYGDANDAVADRASRFYRSGYTTEFRTMGLSDPPMLVPRLDMYYFRNPAAIDRWGSQQFSRRIAGIRLRRAITSWLQLRG